MTWDVGLWCNQCNTNIGSVRNVVSASMPRRGEFGKDDEQSMLNVTHIMREHEVQKHGGKDR